MYFKKYIKFSALFTLLIVVIFFVAFLFTRNSGVTTDGPADFQSNLYRRYFPVALQNAWEDFCAQPRGITEKKSEEVVVSLTSYPARMPTTWLAIESLLRQKIKPSKVVLNLSLEEFPDKKLPSPIVEQIKRGLEVNWCRGNLRSYKKLIPTVRRYPESLIAMVDDDVIYPPNLLEDLLIGHAKYPNCMIAREVREIVVKNKKVLPVSQWKFIPSWWAVEEIPPSHYLVGRGGGGYLVPPHIFHDDLLKENLFMTLAPTDDDMWFYTMIVINGGKVAKIFNNQPRMNIDNTQQIMTSLWRVNHRNNKQVYSETFQRVFRHYNLGQILNAQDALTNESPEVRMSDDIISVLGHMIGFLKMKLPQF